MFTPKNMNRYVSTAKRAFKVAKLIKSVASSARKRSASRSRSPRTIKRQRLNNPFIKKAVKFMTTGYSSGRFRRASKKYAKKNWKKQKYGVSLNKETGKIYTAAECIFVGHSTCPAQTVREMMWRAIIKRLAIQAGRYDITDLSATLPSGTICEVKWHNDGINTPEQNAGYTFGASNSLEDLADWCSSQFRPFNDGENEQRFWKFIRLRPSAVYNPDGIQEARINLYKCILHFDIKSSFKLQNRSINSATWSNEEADNVDNVPLYGKSYEGRGSGAIIKNANKTGLLGADIPNFMADYQHGYIEGGATINNLREPPYASDFMYVRKSGKVRMEPGAIKTSTLSSGGRTTFTELQQALGQTESVLYPGNVPEASKTIQRLGVYRFFGLEKMIDAQASFPMTIATEHNLRMNCWCDHQEEHYTVQITEKTYLPPTTYV
jgi:hypothetical protein